MTAFIELPRLAFDGRPLASWYVNVADIISLVEEYDGQVKIELRDIGTDGMAVTIRTYAPLVALLDLLGELSMHPGVRSWSDAVKHAWSAPIALKLKEAADRERDTYRRGDASVTR